VAACVCQVSSGGATELIGSSEQHCSTSVIISGEVPSCCFDHQTSMVVVCLLCQSGVAAPTSKIWPIGPRWRHRYANV
jgi:hypothetical protein